MSYDREFDSAVVREAGTFPNYPSNNEIMKIAVIGDSWVAGEKLDASIEDSLLKNGIVADVLSYGHPGAKSRQIYRDLIVNENILSDDGVYYVVIVAGVNDTAGHIGRDFYAHHMMNIVYELNNHGKIPVILELPEFDVAALPDIPSTVKAFAYRLLFDGGKTDNIQDYRDAFNAKITDSTAEYIHIPFSPVVSDYSQSTSLYSNAWHLTEEGYALLGNHIGKNIAKYHLQLLQNSLNQD